MSPVLLRPSPGPCDALLRLLLLPALLIALSLRCLFVLLRLPLRFLDAPHRWRRNAVLRGWADRDLRSWSDLSLSTASEAHARSSADVRAEGFLHEVCGRRHAFRIAHAHLRAFPVHLCGVRAQLAAWGVPPCFALAGLAHSVYSTEEFPWGVYHWDERRDLAARLGPGVEALVFLYCSVSQSALYHEIRRHAATGDAASLAEGGLRVRNCHTAQRTTLSPKAGAALVLLLAADLVEQEPFFDLYLPFHGLRLAAAALQLRVPLVATLEATGFFRLTEGDVRQAQAQSRRPLRKAKSLVAKLRQRSETPGAEQEKEKDRAGHAGHAGHQRRTAAAVACCEELMDRHEKFPWLPELLLRACEVRQYLESPLGIPGQDPCALWERSGRARCEEWGSLWSEIATPKELRAVIERLA